MSRIRLPVFSAFFLPMVVVSGFDYFFRCFSCHVNSSELQKLNLTYDAT